MSGGGAVVIDGLDHLVLTVADIERTVAFYTRLLDMRRVDFGEGRVALAFGGQKINLHRLGREFEPKAARPTAGSADFCLLTRTPLEAVLAMAIAGTIAAYWAAAAAIERRQRDMLGAESHSYVTARRDWLRTELRVLHFVWIVVGLELAFLIPWWAEGMRIHFGGFMRPAALLAWWLPLTGIAAFAAWSVSRYQARRREWRTLEEHLQSGHGQSGYGNP